MNKGHTTNPWQNEALKRKNPAKKEGESLQEGEPFIEETLEEEIQDIEAVEKEAKIIAQEADKRPTKELQDELIVLEKTLQESHNKLLMAHAEIENTRRRAQQDLEKAHKYGIENFVKSLLPVVDSLEKALENIHAEIHNAVIEGVELTLKIFLDTLEKFGVEQLNPLNEPFNPQFHEAMSMQENKEVDPNTVIAVLQKGYTLNSRLIRPAMVMVSK